MSLVSAAVTLGAQPNIDDLVAHARPDSLRISIKGTPEEITSAIADLSAKGTMVSATVSLRFAPESGA